jgi:hypothetical protein
VEGEKGSLKRRMADGWGLTCGYSDFGIKACLVIDNLRLLFSVGDPLLRHHDELMASSSGY